MQVPCIFFYFYFNQLMHKYISNILFYIMYTPTCFNIYVILREFLHLCLAKLHNFLKLKLFKLQFHTTIRLKYIKILFGICLVV